MELVDTHCHLTHFSPDECTQVISRAKANEVNKMLCVGSGKGEAWAFKAVDLANSHSCIWAAVGIHPHDAGAYTSLDNLEKLLESPRVVALGETGLDFYRDWAPVEAQIKLFRNSIAVALNHKKPLIIHSRDAREKTIEIIRESGADKVGGVFHCYSEDEQTARKLEQLNFRISFTGVLTFSKADKLRSVAKSTPLKQILLETDCPYMAPEPHRGSPSEPAHVRIIAEKLAQIKSTTPDEVAAVTTQNARNLFGF